MMKNLTGCSEVSIRKNCSNVCAVIQATFKSNSYPGRCLVKIAGKTILEHIVSRIKEVKEVTCIVLATSSSRFDDPIVMEARRIGIKAVRGRSKDVVSRLCKAIADYEGETVLKVNGHYILFDPQLASQLIKDHVEGCFDFSYNEHLTGTVYGTGCEVFQKRILFELNKEKLTPEQREAGTLQFHQYENKYKTSRLDFSNVRPHYRLCFVFEKDIRLLEFIFKNVSHPYTHEIINFLDENPILVEHSNHEAVKEVGLEKLCLFPEKIAALINLKHKSIDTTYPVSVELSLTNRCNMNCVWCSDKALRSRFPGELNLPIIKKLLDDLKSGGTKGVVIEGGGEPTIHENFKQVVKYASSLGLGIGLITNGTSSLKKSIIDKFEWIRVSLDVSNAEEQLLLKGSNRFEEVMNNIKSYSASNATVGVGYVVTSKNMGNIDSLVLRLSNMGIQYIQFRPVIDNPDIDFNVDLSYLKRYQTECFSVITDGMKQNTIEGNSGLSCIAHNLTTVISADGGVYLCGRLNIHPWVNTIGNINNESFRDIWFSTVRKKQSAMVQSASFCEKHCPRCRLTKFNKLFSQLGKLTTRNFI